MAGLDGTGGALEASFAGTDGALEAGVCGKNVGHAAGFTITDGFTVTVALSIVEPIFKCFCKCFSTLSKIFLLLHTRN